ncbi:hypothetical protein AOC05_13690 [Arthrobacter alpinus]|uniref:Uncharacterized protein n=1 Tax=Arthrobacter alpinus TaxID=656366 RepID=A0A0M4QZX3_9MICC|nr:hypothetical protein AOC05_13690 [Arthrobacter alpinus]
MIETPVIEPGPRPRGTRWELASSGSLQAVGACKQWERLGSEITRGFDKLDHRLVSSEQYREQGK